MLTSKPLSGGRELWPSQMRSDAAEQSVALDRAGIAIFRDIRFLAAGPASERSRYADKDLGREELQL